MAENIGKIVVAIEAEVAELRKGLAQAEAEFKKSAKRIEAQQKTLGAKFKKSWTELSAKINVYTMALGAAEKAVKTIDDVTKIWGDDALETHDKVIGTFDALANSGIPVVSQLTGLVQALAYAFSDLDEIQADTAAIEKQTNLVRAQMKMRNQSTEELKKQLAVARGLNSSITARLDGESGISQQYEMQRKAMQQQHQASNRDFAERLRATGAMSHIVEEEVEKRKQLQSQLIDELNEKEQLAMEDWYKRQDEKQEREKERIRKIAEMEEAKAKAVADKTRDMQTKLDIMKAKSLGDEEEAQRIAIKARYAKMIEGANDAQKKILEQMQSLELGKVGTGGGDTADAGGGGGGGTATISTAVGGFTVASGNMEIKKQTSLLKRIADATEKIGEKKGGGEVVILAS